jgi:hypothetical protein
MAKMSDISIEFFDDFAYHNGNDDIQHYWCEEGSPLLDQPTWRVVCQHGIVRGGFGTEAEGASIVSLLNQAYTHGKWKQ